MIAPIWSRHTPQRYQYTLQGRSSGDPPEGRDVLISHEGDEIPDTGGGLEQARALLDATCSYTLNPDVAWRGPNPSVPGRYDRNTWMRLLCVPTARAVGRLGAGDFTASNYIRSPVVAIRYTGAQINKLDQLDRALRGFLLNALGSSFPRMSHG